MSSIAISKVPFLILLAAIPTSTGMSAYYYETQIAQLKNQFATLSGKIDILNANLTQLQSEIDQNSSLDSQQISTLNVQLSQLKSEVNQLTSLNSQTSTQIASLQAKITLLQQALLENLVINQPGAVDFNIATQSFNISVTNLGSISVNITQVTITNLSSTGSSQCTLACILTTASSPGISNSVSRSTDSGHMIQITGLLINDGSGYKVTLTSANGRTYGFFYPWPTVVNNLGQGTFEITAGPLTIYLDFKSFNFTMGSQTQSQTAWVSPTNTPMVFWLKVTNAATDSSIKLRVFSSLLFFPYSAGGLGAATPFYIVDPGTINPNTIQAYDETGNPYNIPPTDPSGPATSMIVKFGATTQGGSSSQTFPTQEQTYLVFTGFYYEYKGNFQGQTIPFVGMKTCSAYPASSCY